MARYQAELAPEDNGTLSVSFPDVPEAHTFGDDEAGALRHAVDALEAGLSFYVEDGRDVPPAGPIRKGKQYRWVEVSAQGAMKLALYAEFRKAGIAKAELARRMGIQRANVARLWDLTHDSRTDQIEAGLRALGKKLRIEVADAA